MSMATLGVFVTTALFAGVAYAQTTSSEPIKTSVCELVKSPDRFTGKMVSVGGRILIAFEDFRLDTTAYSGNSTDLWLEYGSGPKRKPTIWCCGDMTPRDPLRVVQDSEFKRFHRALTAQSRGKGCHEGQCYPYEVTAILTARFDAVETMTCPDDKSLCPKGGGFGRFGLSSARIVIESVSDVVAKSIDPSVHEKEKR